MQSKLVSKFAHSYIASKSLSIPFFKIYGSLIEGVYKSADRLGVVLLSKTIRNVGSKRLKFDINFNESILIVFFSYRRLHFLFCI